jgi:hypothetical protein
LPPPLLKVPELRLLLPPALEELRVELEPLLLRLAPELEVELRPLLELDRELPLLLCEEV